MLCAICAVTVGAMAEIKTIQTEVAEFVSRLPYWQRLLLTHAASGTGVPSDFTKLAYSHLLVEHKLSVEVLEQAALDLPDFFSTSTDAAQFKKLRLTEINSIEHVNAIRPNQRLTFGPNVTVVFGCNGSGKSGFARLMNTAFYSRGDRTILPNIFGPKSDKLPKATFVFQDGTEKPSDVSFPTEKVRAEFKHFAVFDSKSVQVHLNSGNEIYVTPKELGIFERLAHLTTTVTGLFDGEVSTRSKPNNLPSYFDGTSTIKAAVEGLTGKTDLEKVKAHSKLTPEEQVRVKELELEIAKLKTQDVEAKKKELGQIKVALGLLKTEVKGVDQHFTHHAASHYKSRIEGHTTLKKEAEAAGTKQFEDARFRSVGSPHWKEFLQSAQSFASLQKTAPHGHDYPKPGDPCILCRQSLTQEAATLIERYWQYLSGEAEQKLKSSDLSLQSDSRLLDGLSISKPAADSSLYKWLVLTDPEFLSTVIAHIDARKKEIESIRSCLGSGVWADLTLTSSFDIAPFTAMEQNLDKEIVDLNVAKMKEDETKLQAELTVFKHREKLAEHYDDIEKHVLNLRWLDSARELRRKITTKAITDLQKKIHDELLNKKYKQLFHVECQELKAPYQINLEQRGVSGKTLRQLSVEGFQPGQVLSEGEQRAIALADFFTEIEISGIRAGIIFDDPVNSLDHERKEVIAKKLARTSKNRQVIVFTHDLGFIYDLKNECSKAGVDFTCHWVERIMLDSGVVSLGSHPNLEKEYLDTAKAEKKLKEAIAIQDASEREALVREGMGLLRAGYEAFIIMEMFNGTVLRFDRQVKYAQLRELYITREHALSVCDKFGYVSGFIEGHLHSDGYTGTRPTVQLLSDEIAAYKELRQKYKGEKKAALAFIPE